MMKITDNTRGLLYATAAGFLWGVLAVVLKVTLNYVPPKTIAWSRFLIAFVTLFAMHMINNRKKVGILAKPPPLVILSAIFLGFNYVLFMEGIRITTPNNAAIFIQSGPLLLAIIGFAVYKEKIKIWQLFGFVTAIAGFVFFYRDQLTGLFSNRELYNKGVLFIILAGVLWALYSVIQKKLVVRYEANELNLINFGIPVLILIPGIEINSLLNAPWYIHVVILFLGLNTLIAYHFLSMALKYTQANKISIILTANPIITFLAMAYLTHINVGWIKGEIFTLHSLMGAVLVIAGAITVSVFKDKSN